MEILVKPNGPVAEQLAALTVGAPLAMSDPLGGGFPLQRASHRDVLALAAGTAIAPIRAAIDDIVDGRLWENITPGLRRRYSWEKQEERYLSVFAH